MTNNELFEYLSWCLVNVEKSYNYYISTGNKFWGRQFIQDVLRYMEALKQAEKQMSETASCFPKFGIYKNGQQVTIYTSYFGLII